MNFSYVLVGFINFCNVVLYVSSFYKIIKKKQIIFQHLRNLLNRKNFSPWFLN